MEQSGKSPLVGVAMWSPDELMRVWAVCQRSPTRAAAKYRLPLVAINTLGLWAVNYVCARRMFMYRQPAKHGIYSSRAGKLWRKLPLKVQEDLSV